MDQSDSCLASCAYSLVILMYNIYLKIDHLLTVRFIIRSFVKCRKYGRHKCSEKNFKKLLMGSFFPKSDTIALEITWNNVFFMAWNRIVWSRDTRKGSRVGSKEPYLNSRVFFVFKCFSFRLISGFSILPKHLFPSPALLAPACLSPLIPLQQQAFISAPPILTSHRVKPGRHQITSYHGVFWKPL